MENNKGFSLIELIISISIMVIVGSVVVGFLSVSSKSYRRISNEVDLQYESQLAVNQMKDLIMDANKGIAYGLQPLNDSFKKVDATDPTSEAKILAELGGNDEEIKRCLIIYNENVKGQTSLGENIYEFPVIKIMWDPSLREIYFAQKTYETIDELEDDEYLESLKSSDYSLLSQYISSFSVLLTNLDEKEIKLSIGFDNPGTEKFFTTTPTISLRNKVVASEGVKELYKDVEVLFPSLINNVYIQKAGNTITSDDVYVGTDVPYTSHVDIQFGSSIVGLDSVTWQVSGSSIYAGADPSEKTVISNSGVLSISEFEQANTLTLVLQSVADPSKKATATLTVKNAYQEYGYVKTVTVGDLTESDITGPEAEGGTAKTYQYVVEDKEPYIVYANKEKIPASLLGLEFALETEAPADTYVFDQTNGKLKVNYKGNNLSYKIIVRSKATGIDKTNKVVASGLKTIIPTGLQPPIESTKPEAHLVKETTEDLWRGGTLGVKLETSYIAVSKVEWALVDHSGNFVNDNSGWDADYQRHKKSNISLSQTNNLKATVNCNRDLDWNKKFDVSLQVTVSGKNDLGNEITPIVVKMPLSINPVTLEVSTGSKASIAVGSSKPLTFTFTNIKGNNIGNLDLDSVSVYDKGDKINRNKKEWFIFNSWSKTITLSKNYEPEINDKYKGKYRYDNAILRFKFSSYNNGNSIFSNKINFEIVHK